MVKKITLSKGAIAPSRIYDIEPSVTLKWLEEYLTENIKDCYEKDGDWYYGMARGLELTREAATTQAKKGMRR